MTSADNTRVKLLQDGTRDAKILLTLWFLKRLFWPLILLGLIGGVLADDLNSNEVDFSNPESIASKLLSPLVGFAAAVFLKIAVNLLASLAAYPVARERTKDFQNPKYGYVFTRYLDIWQITKGVRTLRWTHHVRQEASKRIKNPFIRSGKLDKIFDVFTIILVVIVVLAFVLVS